MGRGWGKLVLELVCDRHPVGIPQCMFLTYFMHDLRLFVSLYSSIRDAIDFDSTLVSLGLMCVVSFTVP